MSESNQSTNAAEQIREQLSALMDGELSRDETRFLLRRIDADPELAAVWSRYQMARAVLKREPIADAPGPNFSAAVIAKLDFASPVRPAYRVLRWAGGGAIAAAVAVVALMAPRPVGDAGTATQQTIAAVPTIAVPSTAPVVQGDMPREPWLRQIMDPTNFDYAQPASLETRWMPYPQRISRTPNNAPAIPLVQPVTAPAPHQ